MAIQSLLLLLLQTVLDIWPDLGQTTLHSDGIYGRCF